MRIKSIVSESRQIQRAIALIKLGARLQVLESETDLSYERLLRLYKEVQGESPARGMLPFSTDWFMTWQPNIHSSLFLNMYEYLNKTTELEEIDAVARTPAVGDSGLAAGQIRRRRHGDADPLLQVQRQVRHAHLRAHQELCLRPVRTACPCRQGPRQPAQRRRSAGRLTRADGPAGGTPARTHQFLPPPTLYPAQPGSFFGEPPIDRIVLAGGTSSALPEAPTRRPRAGRGLSRSARLPKKT